MKKGLLCLGLTILLTGGGIFTSCENFLKAEELKNQIEAQIAYANALSYTVTVNYDSEEGQLRKPAWGEVSVKATDVFDLKFEPAKNHSFARWEVTSADLPAGESIDDYISIENPNSPETKATFKKELTSVVIKAVSPHLPFTEVTITGSNGKFSPSKGTYTCIDTMTYQLNFEADGDFQFIRWEIYNKNIIVPETTSNTTTVPLDIIENGKYIKIDDVYDSNTSYSFVAVPDDPDIELGIRPVIAERPQTISCTPIYGIDATVNNSIQVIFDHNIDERSIYYSNQERADILESTWSDETVAFLFDDNSMCYGYVTRWRTHRSYYFKNITIETSDGTNLLEYFNGPVFENPRKLTIQPKKDQIAEWTEICVTLSSDFFYEKDGIPVTMPLSKRWLYLVTDDSDDQGPTVKNCYVKTVGSSSVTAYPSKPSTFAQSTDNKLYLDLMINDAQSGPAGNFTMKLQKDGTGTPITKSVNFQSASGNRAVFNGAVAFFGWGLENGVYILVFEYWDNADNKTTYPQDKKYWFKLNYESQTPVPSHFWCVSKEATSTKVAWLPPADTNFEKYGISWEGINSSGEVYSGSAEISKNSISYVIEGTRPNDRLEVQLWTTKTDGSGSTLEGNHIFLNTQEFPAQNISFLLHVTDLFDWTSSSGHIILCGTVLRGSISKSDTVNILGLGKDLQNKTIDQTWYAARYETQTLYEGDPAALYFLGLTKNQVSKGMVICKPGEISNHQKFKAYVCVNSMDNNGVIISSNENRVIDLFNDKCGTYGVISCNGSINPGDEQIVEINLTQAVPVYEGQTFSITVSGRAIANCVILKITD